MPIFIFNVFVLYKHNTNIVERADEVRTSYYNVTLNKK